MTSYRVPGAITAAENTVKGSRFRAVVLPAADEDEIRRLLAEAAAQYRDATHHCWAARLGAPPVERSSDAGEPHGTAGVPILQVLRGGDLSDVLVVVSRWFGGTKLGKGGLARAYAAAARAAVSEAPVVMHTSSVLLSVVVPSGRRGALLRLVRPPAIALLGETTGERGESRFLLSVDAEREQAFLAALADQGLAPAPG